MQGTLDTSTTDASTKRYLWLTRKPADDECKRSHVLADLDWQRDVFARNHPEFHNWYSDGFNFYQQILNTLCN